MNIGAMKVGTGADRLMAAVRGASGWVRDHTHACMDTPDICRHARHSSMNSSRP